MFSPVILFSFRCGGQSLGPPDIHCVSVDENGNILLTWEAPDDPGNLFLNYEVFEDNGSGFSSLILQGPINNTTLFYSAAGASNVISYYIITQSNNGTESPPSEVVNSMVLNVSTSDLNSVAHLSWNSPGDFIVQNSTGFYKIYREDNGGVISQVGEVPVGTTNYTDTLYGLCVSEPVDITYWVELESNFGCVSRSSYATNSFQDLLGPETVGVETVTINPSTGNVEIYWYPSDANDLDHYLIQRANLLQGTFISLENISPPNNSYIYGPATGNGALSFVVIAFDQCLNDNSYDEIVTTIFLDGEVQNCDQRIRLFWNGYSGWDEGVKEQKIWVSENGEPYEEIAVLPPEQLNFTLETEPFNDYSIYVEAVSNGNQRSSFSNVSGFTAAYPSISDVNYLSRVSVLEDNSVEVSLLTDGSGVGMTYELFRSTEQDDNFKSIAVLDQPVGTSLTYIDTGVDPTLRSYYYKWEAFDGCSHFVTTTNISSTIFINAEVDNANLLNKIAWSPYINWNGGVIMYNVLRRLGNEGDFDLIATLGPGSFEYEDNIEPYMLEEGNFCYRIEAMEGANEFNSSETAFSNIKCATPDPIMWIPNAIVLNGHNTVFKPVSGYLDFENYEMRILNRWGEEIFFTKDIGEGWDATYKDSVVPQGVYFYFISYYDGAGNNFLKKGDLYVLP